jgi:hypothetical protein
MPWEIHYFQQQDGTQPAEVFEDDLDGSPLREERTIAGKLIRFGEAVAQGGPSTGGGYAEPCRGHDFWQLKADAGRRRGREFFGWDGDRIVLLSGITKAPREATPPGAYAEADRYWVEYKQTRRTSPESPEEEPDDD